MGLDWDGGRGSSEKWLDRIYNIQRAETSDWLLERLRSEREKWESSPISRLCLGRAVGALSEEIDVDNGGRAEEAGSSLGV